LGSSQVPGQQRYCWRWQLGPACGGAGDRTAELKLFQGIIQV